MLAGVGSTISGTTQVARAGEAVDPHSTRAPGAWPPARTRLPRPDDHVDAPHRLRAAGQCSDRLHAAQTASLDSQQATGAEDDWIDLSVAARRGADDYLQHTGRASGDDPHDGRRRVGSPPTGDIHRGSIHRDLAHCYLLPLRQRHPYVLPHPDLRAP